MYKQRIYVDTSVISHLLHEDAPEKMRDTISFWADIQAGRYDVAISHLTLAELRRCHEPKRSEMFERVEAISYTFLPKSEESETLANAYVREGALTSRHKVDCVHIALAVTSGCDIIVSWNFKHMVRMSTIRKVRTVNVQNGYFKMIDIVSPTTMLLGGGDDDDEGAGGQP